MNNRDYFNIKKICDEIINEAKEKGNNWTALKNVILQTAREEKDLLLSLKKNKVPDYILRRIIYDRSKAYQFICHMRIGSEYKCLYWVMKSSCEKYCKEEIKKKYKIELPREESYPLSVRTAFIFAEDEFVKQTYNTTYKEEIKKFVNDIIWEELRSITDQTIRFVLNN